MSLPSTVTYGKVVGQFVAFVADTDDSDDLPDSMPLSGSITFTPTAPHVKINEANPNPITVLGTPITGTLDREGYLCSGKIDPATDKLRRGVYLVATDNPDLNPYNWNWAVSYNLRLGPNAVSFPAHEIMVTGSSEVDLTLSSPIPTYGGIAVTKGDMGPQGPQGPTGPQGPQGPQGGPTNIVVVNSFEDAPEGLPEGTIVFSRTGG